jgi:hypothetical protein
MKSTLSILFITAVIASGLWSCKKNTITPQQTGKADTSTTLISITALVGKWNIVSDTISYAGSAVGYKGVTGDHFIFTKYGNLYITEGLDNLIDTAIYAITPINNQLSWVNTYLSVNGQSTTLHSNSVPYDITSLDTASMVLTSNVQASGGIRYEQITLKK